MSDEKEKPSKDPVDSALAQIQDAANKAITAKIKVAMEEYVKARDVRKAAQQKLVDLMEEIEDSKDDFSELKTELKAELKNAG